MIRKTYTFANDGNTNDVYTLTNSKGSEVDVLTYGARITRIWMPDKNGNFDDLVVGGKTPEEYYLPHLAYFGATIGRYCNRIGQSQFELNDIVYNLEPNDNGHSLHGGTTENFDAKIWDATIEGDSLILRHFSRDGAGGYPGNLEVKLTVTLTEEDEIVLDYHATTDKDTLCNLTNHTYFNIGGQDTVHEHELMIKAKKITKADAHLIPHGEYEEVLDGPYSFYTPKLVGKDIYSDAEMIKLCNGYDLNYCIERETEHELEHVAYVYDRASGRRMDCYTTLCGVQLFTACKTKFSGKKEYVNHCGLCLETQGYPNSPRCPQYPTTTLKAGETYHEVTVYKFSVVK